MSRYFFLINQTRSPRQLYRVRFGYGTKEDIGWTKVNETENYVLVKELVKG